MNKVTITKNVYELYQQLERLEEVLNFSVFYPFLRAFESTHYLPGFEFELEYYEIHNDNYDELQVIKFPFRGYMGDEGYELDDEEVGELVERLKEI